MQKYEDSGREWIGYTIPGALIDGMIVTGYKLKTAIIKEVYLNDYSSGATIRMYKKMPAKYARIVEMIDAADYNDEVAYEKICKAFYAA